MTRLRVVNLALGEKIELWKKQKCLFTTVRTRLDGAKFENDLHMSESNALMEFNKIIARRKNANEEKLKGIEL